MPLVNLPEYEARARDIAEVSTLDNYDGGSKGAEGITERGTVTITLGGHDPSRNRHHVPVEPLSAPRGCLTPSGSIASRTDQLSEGRA
jgi:hypothetical protein